MTRKVGNLQKIEADRKMALHFTTDSDFEHTIYEGDRCFVALDSGTSYKATILQVNENEVIFKTYLYTLKCAFDKIVDIQPIELKEKPLSDFQYVFTNIGGGWGYTHKLFGITQNGQVFAAEAFDKDDITKDTRLIFEEIGKVEKVDLGLQENEVRGVCDASYVTAYEMKDDLEIVYEGFDVEYSNPELFNDVKKVDCYNYYRNELDVLDEISENPKSQFFIGEISGKEMNSMRKFFSPFAKKAQTTNPYLSEDLVQSVREIISKEDDEKEM